MMAGSPARRAVAGGGVRVRRGVDGRAEAEGLERFVGGGRGGERPIVRIQRARIVGAMLDSVSDRGVGGVSVADVVARSGVSRRTFYELFEDREDCFFAAFEQALASACERVLPAYRGAKSWRERVRTALVALLCFFEEQPQMARVLILGSLAGGARTLRRRTEVLGQLTSIIEEGAGEGTSVLSSSVTGEGVVGGVLAVIQRRLTQERDISLVELVNPLMGMIVLPYLGAGAARRELVRATPVSSLPGRIESSRAVDPFKGAGMRLTYRTVRVLMAVAERPGASNRTVGDIAEIKDQGQISKLLGRLHRAGMLTNTVPLAGQGTPNSWTLTPSGHQVTDSIRAHTEHQDHTSESKPRGDT